MTAPIDAAFFADPRALSALKRDAKTSSPEALKEAARQFESLFTQMLLKSMREAGKSFGDSLFGSEEGDFYQDMFDQQMAVHLSRGRGLGLADMLVRQLQTAGVDASERPESATAASKADASTAMSAHRPIAASKEEFLRTMWPHAERAGRALGVDPHALLAQAALETGWGRAVPCNARGECSFNLFGIKAGSQWSGETVSVPTLEFEEGVAVRKVERFRSYSSPEDSFRDYAVLIRNSPRYERALGTGSDVSAFASALQEGGYATDPSYAAKLVAVANELRNLREQQTFKSELAQPLTDNEGVRT
ncbi:MAG TPA: flagellar assembly peptidoglycan hydrolase FlgJ [Steroidobacter sp.]